MQSATGDSCHFWCRPGVLGLTCLAPGTHKKDEQATQAPTRSTITTAPTRSHIRSSHRSPDLSASQASKYTSEYQTHLKLQPSPSPSVRTPPSHSPASRTDPTALTLQTKDITTGLMASTATIDFNNDHLGRYVSYLLSRRLAHARSLKMISQHHRRRTSS